MIKWDDDGQATFHFQCWKSIRMSVRNTEGVGPLVIPELERDMLLEGMKTMELHNPLSKIQQEAERIARMFKETSYCIAFTGKFATCFAFTVKFTTCLTFSGKFTT